MNDLVQFINLEYSTQITSIPLNKYFRFKPLGSKSKSMWVLYKGEIAFIGDYRTEEPVLVWKSESHTRMLGNMNNYQRNQYLANLEKERTEIEAREKVEKQAFLCEYWESAEPCTKLKPNNYFVRKQVETRSDFKIDNQATLIPMYTFNGVVVGIQAITSDFKWFIKGSQPSGAFYPIRGEVRLRDVDVVYVVEGYATGYSLNEMLENYHDGATHMVLVGFSANNVANIIKSLKEYFPNKAIIGCADNDDPSKKAMRDIPHFWFEGAKGYDANDAWIDSQCKALERLCEELYRMNTPVEGVAELDKFNDIVFDPEPHKYYLNGEEFTSATTWVHQFSSFDANKMAEHVAVKEGKTKEEILIKWKRTADFACKRGTRIHEYLEFIFGGKQCEIGTSAKDLYPIADKFKQDVEGKINIVKQEFRLYDILWKICGTVDALGEVDGKYYIIDWKSNKEINYYNQYGSKLKSPLHKYDDCEMINYSLQLSLYKLMIERNTTIKISGLIIVHFAANGYTKHGCYDMTKEIERILDKKEL